MLNLYLENIKKENDLSEKIRKIKESHKEELKGLESQLEEVKAHLTNASENLINEISKKSIPEILDFYIKLQDKNLSNISILALSNVLHEKTNGKMMFSKMYSEYVISNGKAEIVELSSPKNVFIAIFKDEKEMNEHSETLKGLMDSGFDISILIPTASRKRMLTKHENDYIMILDKGEIKNLNL